MNRGRDLCVPSACRGDATDQVLENRLASARGEQLRSWGRRTGDWATERTLRARLEHADLPAAAGRSYR